VLLSEAPTSEDLPFRCAVYGRFRYSDLKEAAPRAPLQELRNRSSYTQPRRFCVRQRDKADHVGRRAFFIVN